jgi:uncharacterized membrane protein (DUF485 family)
MKEQLMEKIENNPSYQKLVKRRSAFAWKLAIVMLVVYYTFIMIIAFAPEVLGKSMGGVMTVGIPVGVAIILFSFLLTGIYTKRANGEFDDLVNQLKEDVKGDLS